MLNSVQGCVPRMSSVATVFLFETERAHKTNLTPSSVVIESLRTHAENSYRRPC